MRQSKEIVFVATVVSVIALIGGLSVSQISSQMQKPTLVNHLAIQTQIVAVGIFGNRSTTYAWGLSLTNEGGTPVISIKATLNMSAAAFVGQDGLGHYHDLYVMNQFLIVQALGPAAISFVRNPPLPFVDSNNPLLFNNTADNGMIISQGPSYLQFGQSLPVSITIAYANGTVFSTVVSAQVEPIYG